MYEKLAFLGGAGLFPEGSLGVNTRYQKEHGIKTTVQQVLEAALQFHHYRADPAVLRVLIQESEHTINEIQDMGLAAIFSSAWMTTEPLSDWKMSAPSRKRFPRLSGTTFLPL